MPDHPRRNLRTLYHLGTNPEMGVPAEAFPEVRDHNDQQAYDIWRATWTDSCWYPHWIHFYWIVYQWSFVWSARGSGDLKGQTIKEGVTGIIVPGSRPVRKAAEAIGLDKVFIDAGFEWRSLAVPCA